MHIASSSYDFYEAVKVVEEESGVEDVRCCVHRKDSDKMTIEQAKGLENSAKPRAIATCLLSREIRKDRISL